MVTSLFKFTFRKDPTGVGENLNITPDAVMGPMFVEQISAPSLQQEQSPQRTPLLEEEVVQRPKARISNAAVSGLRRLF